MIIEFVYVGVTVNGTYYAEVLRTKLRPAIRQKRHALYKAGVVLIHDNATPHKSNPIKTVIDHFDWEILPHSSYSPDLSPYDYDLFPKLKCYFGE